MTYLVTDNCIKCKYQDCVECCPVDCFYEGENMLVIDPEECIDCGVCVPECPADAIVPDNELEGDIRVFWERINAEYAQKWPNITEMREEDILEDAADWDGVENKFDKHFSPEPGKGD